MHCLSDLSVLIFSIFFRNLPQKKRWLDYEFYFLMAQPHFHVPHLVSCEQNKQVVELFSMNGYISILFYLFHKGEKLLWLPLSFLSGHIPSKMGSTLKRKNLL